MTPLTLPIFLSPLIPPRKCAEKVDRPELHDGDRSLVITKLLQFDKIPDHTDPAKTPEPAAPANIPALSQDS
jgi:hypothetical protein